jgi:hypothetical protein
VLCVLPFSLILWGLQVEEPLESLRYVSFDQRRLFPIGVRLFEGGEARF